MVAILQNFRIDPQILVDLVRPDPLPDGHDPETREILCGLSWARYLALDAAYGDDRSVPRLYYLDGSVEIMSTSDEHERIKRYLAAFIDDFLLDIGMEAIPRGQATMWLEMKAAGAEPDDSWCLHEAKTFPDIVLEIALTSGGLDKLEIYRRFAIPEVWIWLRDGLHLFILRAGATGYDESPASALLPALDPAILQRCVGIDSWQKARRTFREILRAR